MKGIPLVLVSKASGELRGAGVLELPPPVSFGRLAWDLVALLFEASSLASAPSAGDPRTELSSTPGSRTQRPREWS